MLELDRLGATDVVLSTNIPLRNDGMPYSDWGRRRIDDPGVAVYFRLNGRPMSMARDGFQTIHDNLRSLGLAIEHLRGLERHGGGSMIERAFTGFVAIAAEAHWRGFFAPYPAEVSTGGNAAVLAHCEARYRDLAKAAHPDRGGSLEAFQSLNSAIQAARRELASRC